MRRSRSPFGHFEANIPTPSTAKNLNVLRTLLTSTVSAVSSAIGSPCEVRMCRSCRSRLRRVWRGNQFRIAEPIIEPTDATSLHDSCADTHAGAHGRTTVPVVTLGLMMAPGVHSLALGLCLCLLYSGYETARASSLSLFNSTDASGSSIAVLSFVLSFASLQLYGRGTEVLDGRWTLATSSGFCCAVFLGFALVSFEVDMPLEVVSMLFSVRETYVALIGTQVWGMLSSSLKERGSESRRWFCIIQVRVCL